MLDPTIRWTDRLQSSSGDWSGNVFDFFFRVNSKIAKDIKKPFKLEGITRVDDTPVHKAVREALVNCLVNTDYFLPCGVVIKKTSWLSRILVAFALVKSRCFVVVFQILEIKH